MKGIMKKPELLSPAGSYPHFLAAVENGADGVYFGGKAFNARQSAKNFSGEEIRRAAEYAKLRNVNTYLTVNTLVRDDEFSLAFEQVEEGLGAGISGFIIQDLGLGEALLRRYPGIRLHLSTQGTVYNREGAAFAGKAGYQRVVLARELSREQIGEITRDGAIETEVFVHGALCVCYSGQCMMSRMIGQRSGNRGSCAQPCRLPYRLEGGRDKTGNTQKNAGKKEEDWGYLLSPKDLCLGEDLRDLVRLGVDSLKIEGRMKSPEYTALVTGVYRRCLDRAYEACLEEENRKSPTCFQEPERSGFKEETLMKAEEKEALLQLFNRGGFTRGYFDGLCNAGLLSGESPKHQGFFLGRVKRVVSSGKQKGKFLAEIIVKRPVSIGDGVEILSEQRPGGVITYIKGKKGPQKEVLQGERVLIGDLPGPIGIGDPVYKISDSKLTAALRKTYEGKSAKKLPIRGKLTARENAPLHLALWDDTGVFIETESEEKLQKRQKGGFGLTEDRILQQLGKTGDSPFYLADCEIQLQEDVFFTVAQLNRLRRSGLEALEERKKDGAGRKDDSVCLPVEK